MTSVSFSWKHSVRLLVALLGLFLTATVTGAQQSDPMNFAAMKPGETAASMTEEEDHYVVRINLPGRDMNNVSVRLKGDRLLVDAPASGTFRPYRQEMLLEGVSSGSKMTVDRRDQEKTIVVVVPKGSPSALSQVPRVARHLPSASRSMFEHRDPFEQMNEIMNRQMALMQEEMFRMMEGLLPKPKGSYWGDQEAFSEGGDPATTLQEEKDRYLVQAKLPNPQTGSINVGVKDRILTIEAKEQTDSQGSGSSFARYSEYSQSMELPGPVQIAKMKVDRKGDMLVIMLPKASS